MATVRPASATAYGGRCDGPDGTAATPRPGTRPRLVAAELERRWEVALVELCRAEAALAQHTASVQAAGLATLDPQLRAQALLVGQRLPELWADPGVSREHRKALLRCRIDKLMPCRTARDATCARIVWRGGDVSEMQVALPVNGLAALPRGAEMEARVPAPP
jgi:hypothetical protein